LNRTAFREIELPSATTTPPIAREIVRDYLMELGRDPEGSALELIASELVTNAVLHADRGTIVVRLSTEGERARIEVEDAGGADRPHIVKGRRPGSGGHGLRIVEELALTWGITVTPASVWAEVAL
jgi:anti-sigma regulatory factor (Ser/Thr protein kinase)